MITVLSFFLVSFISFYNHLYSLLKSDVYLLTLAARASFPAVYRKIEFFDRAKAGRVSWRHSAWLAMEIEND